MDAKDNLKNPLALDGANMFGFGNKGSSQLQEDQAELQRKLKAKSAKVNTRKVPADLQKLYTDYSKKSAKAQELDDIVSPGVKSNDSAYASNRGNPTKKKQVETPAFGKQKTTFFKDNL